MSYDKFKSSILLILITICLLPIAYFAIRFVQKSLKKNTFEKTNFKKILHKIKKNSEKFSFNGASAIKVKEVTNKIEAAAKNKTNVNNILKKSYIDNQKNINKQIDHIKDVINKNKEDKFAKIIPQDENLIAKHVKKQENVINKVKKHVNTKYKKGKSIVNNIKHYNKKMNDVIYEIKMGLKHTRVPENLSMDDFDLRNIISAFEIQKKDCFYNARNNSVNDLTIIKQDVDRSFHFITGKSVRYKFTYKKILYEVLISIPIDYIQNMSNISLIIIYFYFRDKIDEETEKNDIMTIFLDLLEVTKISITNILKEKVEPLLDDDFSLYLKYNNVFIRMMENRGIKISYEKSLTYMNNTLTWFCMSFKEVGDIFRIAGIILTCPTTVYFLILIKFFDIIDKKIAVEFLEPNLYEQLVTLEKEFLETENSMRNE
ncbi:hypothetical protein COBT_000937 [Conglomerata obtusa]